MRKTPGYRLLLRGAFVRQLGQGIFSYLPLAWRVMHKLERVMREEMDAAGGVEMSMPVVHPGELWKRSGRYDTIGPEMARFADRRDRPHVLAMTHEEVVASLAASESSRGGSYQSSSTRYSSSSATIRALVPDWCVPGNSP